MTISVAAASVVAVTLQLVRLSVDLVQMASQQSTTETSSSASASNTPSPVSSTHGKKTTGETASLNKGSTQGEGKNGSQGYGSVASDETEPFLDEQGLQSNASTDNTSPTSASYLSPLERFQVFLAGWALLLLGFLVTCLFVAATAPITVSIFPASILVSTVLIWVVEIVCLILDSERVRYGSFARIVRLTAMLILWVTYMTRYLTTRKDTGNDTPNDKEASSISPANLVILIHVTLAVLWAIADGWITTQYPTPARRESLTQAAGKPTLSRQAVLTLIQPYFWPSVATGDATAFWNRVRAIATWVCVIGSKACNLVTPLLLGQASTALAHGEYNAAIRYSIFYAFLKWLGNTFKEGQSLVYLKVAQAAFVQLSETSFEHLHQLSLDWHLRKKLGEVLRSMDRGISACDTLMKYLFLWLVPAFAECLLVTIIFATYFQYFPLAVSVFYFVFVYVVWTILVTLWRKKFRKALVKHDNEWHDLFTDSMVNFETVKYFTAENYEKERFADAVERYQVGSVHVQGSLSFLNVSQQFILQGCMATALSLAAFGIEKRTSCCVETAGCETGISDCCRNVSSEMCPGMEVGDFVAVLTYISQLFTPLNFLGSVYNAIVMAMIDLTNLSELLAESPDVTDASDAFELPETNIVDPDVAVEFDNVHFHYPTQPETRGLKGLSFKMKRGTTTAIVGPTGAGKTTVSRLLFRFYDVLGGAVKVNGVDVRSVTQTSLRGSLGVVPQAASLFNDTIRFNLKYGRPDATEEELIQAAEDAQLLGFIESLNDGWDTMVGDRGLKLSGGEKQRAAIARCLLKDPPFVLLDEATSALDTITEKSVQEALDRLGEKRTVLVIAHRLGTIRRADNIIVLKDGAVAEQGTHEQLLALDGTYSDMWNMQLHSEPE
mmetsp:Transcript_37482/g.77758  ORF Transcript_37482/g.77758 Transcript_37482/m.77758 type:complete len:894 (-) Transcript_37482:401-3082(-)|eukprot:CAMPEP_0172454398 /NCGR_PEP_ID=MMETSP1065-20121228/11395_1 /TAXON_ID=265537 /ORGANISM="Amphiprora paludosa, Strain CCMP125" /LENGTH=893 /DNA_ID=CAMNT_0013206721 /DNA_START=62 /DNA_END=2743 /DNA_ORIENTATION=+